MSKRLSVLLAGLGLAVVSGYLSTQTPAPVVFENNGKRPPVETILGLSGEEGERVATLYGPPLRIDKIFPSMAGPTKTEWMALQAGSKELNWIVGAKAVIVEPDSPDRIEQEYMCHTNLAIVSPSAHIQRNLNTQFNDGYLFAISQGKEEIRLPDGFGIPILGETAIKVGMQALNLNKVPSEPFDVRHQVSFLFRKQSDLKQPLKPLLVTNGAVLKPFDGRATQFAVQHQDADSQEGCLVATPGTLASDSGLVRDKFNQDFMAHWIVEKGREVTRTNVTEMLQIPYDTTIHYLFVHVHPFAESMELRDLTTNTSVVKLQMKQYADKIGLSRTEHFTSLEGLPVYKDHEYEMVSVYNNTSDSDQDAMAVMQLYMLDKEFDPATASTPQTTASRP